MTSRTFNEILYEIAQEISPDAASTLNEEVIEAAIEAAELPVDAQNYNAALVALAYKILGITAPPSPSENALVQADAEAVVDALRQTEDSHLRETESGQIRRTE